MIGQKRHQDIVIVGGAVIGSSVAYWLSRLDPGLRVVVVEPEPGYARSGTALSAASIRSQFSTEINVRISQFGADFLRTATAQFPQLDPPPDMGFRENGYLFLACDARQAAALRRDTAMQREAGAGTLTLDAGQLAQRFPWMTVDDIALAGFGARDEGWFDSMALLQAFRAAARAAGVQFLKDRVVGLERQGPVVAAVRLESGARLQTGAVVNAAGTRAAGVAAMAGCALPVEPRKRTVFHVHAPEAEIPQAPLIVDPGGWWARPEGQGWLCALSPEDDAPCDPNDFAPDLEAFEAQLWPRLYARIPGFAAARVQSVWAGHYAYNPVDRNALLGRLPEVGNLYFANGFSGHGLQQAPAVGRGIAELILHGRYTSLDLTPLDVSRVVTGSGQIETGVV